MKKIRMAVVGATGLVGRTALKVLEEKNLPIDEYVLFASSKSAGKKLKFMGKDYIVQELTETSFDSGFDYAIFSAGGSTSKKYAPIAASKGCIVVDNSSAFRMDENVPLVVPEVNSEEIIKNHGIIANPNCSTIQAVVALKPLDEKYKIKRIVYSTYQAVSGAGKNGVIDLDNGVKNYLTNKSYEDCSSEHDIPDFTDIANYDLVKFNYPIFSNCLPHIDVFLDNGYTKEEEKMINETRKILKNPNLKITATTVRVPVFNCHSESINIEFENEFNLDDLISTLKNSPGIIVQDDPKREIYPLAINASGHDEVFVGRIRRDDSVNSGVNLWVVADNIRKGAASNAVQIIEKLIK
jgi:aspartate-semialdehyde dehydrogenase